MINMEPDNTQIEFGNKQKGYATKRGEVTLLGREGDVHVKGVLYSPSLTCNLLSVGVLTSAGFSVTFRNRSCLIRRGEVLYAAAILQEGLWRVETRLPTAKALVHGAASSDWHARMGHLNGVALKRMKTEQLVNGLETLKEGSGISELCTDCLQGKGTKETHKAQSRPLPSRRLERASVDLCGPISPQGVSGARYFLVIAEHTSRMIFVYFLREKSGTTVALKQWIAYAENHTSERLVCLESDNGGEFTGTGLKEYLDGRGTQHVLTAPYNPEQNCTAEKANRTLLDGARTVLTAAKLPRMYWPEAVAYIAYTRNRSRANSRTVDKVPIHTWESNKPDVGHMQPFGCEVYAYVPRETRKKLDARMIAGKLLGYLPDRKGYRVLTKERTVIKVRDARFVGSATGEIASDTQREQLSKETQSDTNREEGTRRSDATPQSRKLDFVQIPQRRTQGAVQVLLTLTTEDPASYDEAINSRDS